VPIDLTSECRSVMTVRGMCSFRLSINWNGDGNEWMAGIWAVQRVDSCRLFERLVSDHGKRIPRASTLQWIRNYQTDDTGDGLMVVGLPSASLLCSYTRTRIKVPVRSTECTHLQCFDLLNFLAMNERNPKWKCPDCNKDAHYSKLRIDEYFCGLVKEIDLSITVIDLLSDGSWLDAKRFKEEPKANDPTVQAALVEKRRTEAAAKKDVSSVVHSVVHSGVVLAPAPSVASVPAPAITMIIQLDEEVPISVKLSESLNQSSRTVPNEQVPPVSKEVEVVDILDSDGEGDKDSDCSIVEIWD